MSKMIPQETIDVLRNNNDISVDIYGIECTLNIPANKTAVEGKDAFTTEDDYAYTTYTEHMVVIEWSPNTKRLRKLGIFTEEDIPLICWFQNDPEVIVGSYFTIATQYIPDQMDTDTFEIVDVMIRGMHDKVALRGYVAAPWRAR